MYYGSGPNDYFALLQRLAAHGGGLYQTALPDAERDTPAAPFTAFAPGLGATQAWLQSAPPAWMNDFAGLFTGATDPMDWYYRDMIARSNLLAQRFPALVEQ